MKDFISLISKKLWHFRRTENFTLYYQF